MIGRHLGLVRPASLVRLVRRLALTALLILSAAPSGWAATAQDQLKGAIDRVVNTLESPALKGAG